MTHAGCSSPPVLIPNLIPSSVQLTPASARGFLLSFHLKAGPCCALPLFKGPFEAFEPKAL